VASYKVLSTIGKAYYSWSYLFIGELTKWLNLCVGWQIHG